MVDIEELTRYIRQRNINYNHISYRIHYLDLPDASIPIFDLTIRTDVLTVETLNILREYMEKNYYELYLIHVQTTDDLPLITLEFKKMPPY